MRLAGRKVDRRISEISSGTLKAYGLVRESDARACEELFARDCTVSCPAIEAVAVRDEARAAGVDVPRLRKSRCEMRETGACAGEQGSGCSQHSRSGALHTWQRRLEGADEVQLTEASSERLATRRLDEAWSARYTRLRGR